MLAFYVAILDTEEQKDKFTEIYTTYYGMMYQVARAITHDDKLAEDALHETCLELIEKIDSIRTDNAKQLAYYLRDGVFRDRLPLEGTPYDKAGRAHE